MKKRIFIFILISIGCTMAGNAQQQYYNWRIGAGAGVMYYHGDLSNGLNANALSWPAYQIFLGRMISPSFSIELNSSWGILTGSDRTSNWRGNLQSDNPNFNRGLNFETRVRSANLVLQYRFNNGVLLSRYARFSPYLFAGAGFTDFEVYSNLLNANGQAYYYWPDNTIRNAPEGDPLAEVVGLDDSFETRVSSSEKGASYPTQIVTIPFGAGLQVRLADRLSANLRAEARYAFTDYLDNASTNGNRHDMYFLGTLGLHYHFNFSNKKFKAPAVYVGYDQPSADNKAAAKRSTTDQRAIAYRDSILSLVWVDIDKIPAGQKQSVDKLNASSEVTAPDTLPGSPGETDRMANKDDATRNTADRMANKDASIQPDSIANNRSFESQFSFSRQFGRDTIVFKEIEKQRIVLLSQQEKNAEAIRQSEEELERLKVQLDNMKARRTDRSSSQPNSEQEQANDDQLDEERQLRILNNRVQELNNSVDRLRRENETYSRQTRRIDRTRVANELALLGTELNTLKKQKRSNKQDKALTAKVDSLNVLVVALSNQLASAANRADTIRTPDTGSGNTFQLESPLEDDVPALYAPADRLYLENLMAGAATLDEVAVDSLQKQLAQLRQSVDSLQSYIVAVESKPAAKVKAPYGTLSVYFPLNSAAISEADKRRIAVLAERLKASPESLVQVKGFTDNTGKADYNLALSRRRAETIRDYLVAQSGVAPDRIVLNYYGQAKASEGGKNAYDRRVELELYVEE